MQSYSPYFQTIHDEPAPYGDIGRGTHYSVLRAAVWHNQDLTPQKQTGLILTFAVIWDEDHDTRVIQAAERLYLQGTLPAAIFIGERKGSFSFLTEAGCALAEFDEQWGFLQRDVQEATNENHGDFWPAEVHQYTAKKHSIIDADYQKVQVYLENIKQLWHLGIGRPPQAIPPSASPKDRVARTDRPKYALT